MRILKGLGSRSLGCGCLVGLYETYDSRTVAIIDARGSGCAETAHRRNSRIDLHILNAALNAAGAPLAPDAPIAPIHPPSTIPTRNR